MRFVALRIVTATFSAVLLLGGLVFLPPTWAANSVRTVADPYPGPDGPKLDPTLTPPANLVATRLPEATVLVTTTASIPIIPQNDSQRPTPALEDIPVLPNSVFRTKPMVDSADVAPTDNIPAPKPATLPTAWFVKPTAAPITRVPITRIPVTPRPVTTRPAPPVLINGTWVAPTKGVPWPTRVYLPTSQLPWITAIPPTAVKPIAPPPAKVTVVASTAVKPIALTPVWVPTARPPTAGPLPTFKIPTPPIPAYP